MYLLMRVTWIHPLQTQNFSILAWWSPWALEILLPTKSPAHTDWTLMSQNTGNLSVTHCVYTTQHAVLPTHLQCFWCVGLAMGLKSPTKHYMTSRTMHQTQWSSNCINRNHDSSFGFRSCQKHVISHTISAKDFYTSMGVPLASWNRHPLSNHQTSPILSFSSGIVSVCDQQQRTLHLPDSLSQVWVHCHWTDATGAAYTFLSNYKVVHRP